jgi:SAM-dependent methyltransferase
MPAIRFPHVQFFGRTWREYEQIWNLRLDDLHGKRVLDCPCGPASFVSEARRRGIDIVGCDPLFALPLAQLRARGEADIAETMRLIRTQNPMLAGNDPEVYASEKRKALDELLNDFALHGPSGTECDGRYVNAALPSLPFTDHSFDVVLSAHFLFTYAAVEDGGMMATREFDLDFHLRATTELARVAREIRLYPCYGVDPAHPMRHPYADPVLHHLQSIGMNARYERSTYDQGVPEWNFSIVASR